MRVYLIRHVHAVPDSFELSDESRWLSAHGRELAVRVGARMREEGITLDAVVTSPLVRAVQTAELLAAGAGYPGEIEALEALRPSGSRRAIGDELPTKGLAVGVVGHEPFLSALGAHLAQRGDFPSFRKGEVILIEDEIPRWRLDPDRLAFEALS